jgi:hypothetical protein
VSVSITSHSSAIQYPNSVPSWEEPHPGRRLSCTFTIEPGMVDGLDCHHTQEDGRTGNDTVGPPITVQAPTAVVSPAACQDKGALASSVPSVVSSLTVAPDTDSAISGSLSDANVPVVLLCQTPLDVEHHDEDTTMFDTTVDQAPPCQTPLSPVIEIRDVSDYLGNGSFGHHLDIDMEFQDSAFPQTPPTVDLYGWDAEFSRRGVPASPSSDSGSDSIRDIGIKHYTGPSVMRRGSTQRFGLLHRVLSTSKVSSRTSTRRVTP